MRNFSGESRWLRLNLLLGVQTVKTLGNERKRIGNGHFISCAHHAANAIPIGDIRTQANRGIHGVIDTRSGGENNLQSVAVLDDRFNP